MSNKASQFVGGIPENYDRGLGPYIFEDYATNLATRVAALKPARVLELAAGTGIVSRKLRDALEDKAHLIVTDLNPPMLEVARSKFSDEENVEFVPADALQLDFSDDSFDVVVCQFGVMFFPDKIASYREALRVLRPGGRYLFNTWGTWQENLFSQIAQDASEKLFTGEPPAFYRVPFSYADAKFVHEEMAAGGFQQTSHEAVSLEKEVDSWQRFARGLVYGNPLIDEIQAQEGLDPIEVEKVIAKNLKATFGVEPGPMLLKANFFSGLAPEK